MSFLNSMLLFGAGLAALPVILHLLMRNKPKKLRFPALRLLQIRKRTNTRRMRLRHLWLLLLRVLVILLIVFALARPTLPAADYSLSTREKWTLAAILVAATIAYLALQRFWNGKSLPGHLRRERTTLLRGGVGLGTVLLMLLLFLWPYGSRIAAAWTDPRPPVRENFPVSAVLLFDVSPSMSYRQENATRLDVARRFANELMSRVPSGSQIAVSENAGDAPIVFQSDATSAQDRVEHLAISDRTVAFDQRVRAAIQLQVRDRERLLQQRGGAEGEASDAYLREIYVFTDLAKHAWRQSAARALQAELKQHDWLALYLVDVSEAAPRNVMLQIPKLSANSVPRGGILTVRTGLVAEGSMEGRAVVELFVRDADGQLAKRATQPVDMTDPAKAFAEFPLPALEPGLMEGELRLVSSDPMTFDDRRFFTAEVVSVPRVLVIADDPVRGGHFATFLAPAELRERGRARYDCEVHPAAVLDRIDLDRFDVVCLLSVDRPTERAWNRLEEFVQRGKGLFVSLGTKQIDPLAYEQSVSARNLLPGKLLAQLPFTPHEYLDLGNREHPLLQRFEELGGFGQLLTSAVYYRWVVEPTEGGAVIAAYTNERRDPALLEKNHGRGRTLMLTSDVLPGSWNDLAFARLEFLILADFMMQRVNASQHRTLNIRVGESASVPVPEAARAGEFLLRSPALRQIELRADEATSLLTTPAAEQAGHYSLRGRDGDFRTGYSANIAPDESDLRPLSSEDMLELFGEGRFGVARSLDELEPVIRDRRIGQELVPFLLVCLWIVFGLEQYVANRFYQDEEGDAEPSPRGGQLTPPKAA